MIEINGTSLAIGATETLIIFGLVFAYLTIDGDLRRKKIRACVH